MTDTRSPISPHTTRNQVICFEDLEWWADTAAHPGPYRAAIAAIKKMQSDGKTGQAYWNDEHSTVKVREVAGALHDVAVDASVLKLKRFAKVQRKPVERPKKAFSMTPLQELVLKSLPGMGATTSAVAKLINKPVAGTNSSLQSLLKAGIVTVEQTEGNLYWRKK
jgi:hypothetical protein